MRALAAGLAFCASAATAVPPDLKVSTDDLNEAGSHSLELQANKGRGWPLQLLGEYAYGIAEHWQLAVKLPFAREDGLRSLGGGLEARYLAAHDRDAGGYWGLDVSASRQRDRRSHPYVSSVELQPVLGYRAAGWHLALNLPLGIPSSGPDRRATLGVQAKAGRRIAGQEVAVEYFKDGGDPRPEYLFLAWDNAAGLPLHLALGRGLTVASERRVLKLFYSHAF